MAYLATNIFNADGVKTFWDFSFAGVSPDSDSGTTPYLYAADVKAVELYVDVDGNPAAADRIVTIDPLLPNRANIDGPAIAAGRQVKIYRQTEIRFPLVDYRDRQSVSERDLDLANRQSIFIAQETQDTASNNLQIDKHDNLDAKDRRIVNLAPGIAPRDAVNLLQVQTMGQGYLRVPEPFINPLPNYLGRANRMLSFDALGQPTLVVPASGSAAELALNLMDPALGAGIVRFQQLGAGAVPRLLSDKVRENLSAADFGAVSGLSTAASPAVTANTLAIQASVNALTRAGSHKLPRGKWVIDAPIVFNKGFQDLDWEGELIASDNFVGEYLVIMQYEASENFYRWPQRISRMFLNCRYKTRGISIYAADHMFGTGIRIEASSGRGMFIDRMRESCFVFPHFVNCAHRDNFVTPADYNAGTAYVAGNYARVVDPTWVGAAAVPDNIVREGANRYICLVANTGDQPSVTPLKWKRIPHEDYLCVLAGTNKNPQTFNTNNVTVGNRNWQKAYQDEAVLEVVDYAIDGGDRTNQVVFVSPVIRDCGNKCFMRVDSSKTANRPVTHIDVFGGHFHGLAAQQAGIVPELPIPDLQRCIEIGYAINTNIYGANIRCGDGNDCIAILYGDGSTTKAAQDLRVRDCALSSDGTGGIGMLVMPSPNASLSAVLEVSYLVTHATSTSIHDPRRVFRRTMRTESRTLLPPGLQGVVGGYTVLNPLANGLYGDVRAYSYQNEGEAGTRFDVQVTPNRTSMRLGVLGDNTFVEWRNNVATPNRMTLSPGSVLEVPASWDFPMIWGSRRVWFDATGILRHKATNPTSDTDGAVIGAQT